MNKKLFFTAQFILFLLFANAKEKVKYTVFPTESKIIFDMCFFENGEKLAVADDKNIKIFSTKSKQLLDELTLAHTDKILTIDVSDDNNLLASGGRDGSVILWDIREKSTIQSFLLNGTIVTSVSISPDNKYLAAGNSKGIVIIYDIEKENVKLEINDHKKDITSIKFSPDGKLLATASGDKTIHLYSVENWNLMTTLKEHKNWIRDISFDNSEKLVSCGDDSNVIFWDISNLKNIDKIKIRHGHLNLLTSIDLITDNSSYVLTSLNGKIEILTTIGTYMAKLNRPVNKACFIPYETDYMKLVVATRGLGVLQINAEDMKVKVK